MQPKEIQNLIKELIEKTGVGVTEISATIENPEKTWFKVEVSEPHFFISREGEGLSALNHIVRRIIESKTPSPQKVSLGRSPFAGGEESPLPTKGGVGGGSFLIDINGFQKKRVENLRAVAHMMAERARYFKSNIEVDPMSSFERRVVHEFLSNETDLKTESVGSGSARRVVIKYLGGLS